MFLPPINELEHFEGNYMKNSLQNLGETIQSLLGFKKDLTFTWAESVRLIIEDLSSAVNSPDSSGSLIYLKDAKLSEKENCDLASAILKLEDELAALKVYLGKLDAKRRETLNKLLDLKGSIRVFCRVRPFVLSDKQAYPGPFVVSAADKLVIKLAGGKAKEYNFDKVFLPGASQDEIFSEVEPIIRSALDGHNVCIFAYGQTGTGKTFTMEGKPDCPGVVPHAIQELFRHAFLDRTVTFTFTFSMLEVYMGNVRDLLSSRSRKAADHKPKCLSIQMDAKGAVEIESLREVIITNPSQAIKLYGRGSRARSTAWTNANEASSRSHCLIRIAISYSGPADKYRDTSKLWMVDLGGSERLVKTQSTGQTMEEGKAINMSLSALGDVISALQKKQAHIPYRNSKLTQILRDSVGEGSRMLMLVHISPHEDDLSETICSLSFATRVRGTHLGWELSPEVKVQKAATMAELMQQMRCLEDDCQSARNNMQSVEFLLREKKKYLEKSDHETPELPARQVTETHNIELGNVAQGSVGLPRYMNSTACSRIRGKSSDADIKYPGSTKTREHLNSRRNSLLGSAKTVIFPEMDQSLCSSESTLSNNSVLRQSSLSIKKDLNRTYSNQYNIEESPCFAECSTPKDIGMLDNKRNSLLGSAKNVIFPEMDQSLCSSESSLSNNSVLRQSLLSNKKNSNRMYSNQYNIEESHCFSECSTPKDIVMLDNEKMNEIYSKWCSFDGSQLLSDCNMHMNSGKANNKKVNTCTFDELTCLSDCSSPKDSEMADSVKVNESRTFDESTCLSDCSTPKNSEMADNLKVNESRTSDESTCLSDCSTPKDSEMADSVKVNESFFNKCTIDVSKCFSERNMPETGLMHSSMPHSKRVIALQTAPNKTVNRDILSNNIIDKSELTVIKKIACNWPMNNKGEYDQTILWKQPSNGKEECNRSPYKQFPMQKTLKPHISREDTMTFENKISVLMAATELTTTKPAEAAPKKEITETVAKPTTGLCFPMMKIAYALGLGVGLLKVGLEDDFFNGLLV